MLHLRHPKPPKIMTFLVIVVIAYTAFHLLFHQGRPSQELLEYQQTHENEDGLPFRAENEEGGLPLRAEKEEDGLPLRAEKEEDGLPLRAEKEEDGLPLRAEKEEDAPPHSQMPEFPRPEVEYPYPSGTPTATIPRSTTHCAGHPRCELKVLPVPTDSDLYPVSLAFTRLPLNTSLPAVHLHIPPDDIFLPPQVLILPASKCTSTDLHHFDCTVPCPTPCRVSADHKDSADATFYIHRFTPFPTRAHPTQKIIMWDSEFKKQADAAVMKEVDIVMDSHHSGHVRLLSHDNKYFTQDELAFDSPAFPEGAFDGLCCTHSEPLVKDALAVLMHNYCDEWRTNYLAELQKYIHVSSFGGCWHNRDLVGGEGGRFVQKINIMSQFKFCLTWENEDRYDDWVTEKMSQSLRAGCVPVYRGAPNIEDYVPCEHCYINVKDFPTVKDLADYLIYLDQNEEEYNKYLEYKRKPLLVKPTLLASKRFSWCGVCHLISMEKLTGVPIQKIVWDDEKREYVPLQ